jgi:hypothetical protein
MEYLMTYGWAILIIAVVLAVLFSLNVFNTGGSVGSSCIGRPGYSCSAVILTHAGLVSFTVGQAIGAGVYNAQFACVSNSNSIPPNLIAYYAETQTGTAIGTNGIGVYPAQSANIPNFGSFSAAGVQCYPGTTSISSAPFSTLGGAFTGTLWIAYSTSAGGPATTIVQMATFATKSSS